MAQRSVKVPTRLARIGLGAEPTGAPPTARTQTRRVSRSAGSRQRRDGAAAAAPAAPTEAAVERKNRSYDPVTITHETVITGHTADVLLAMHLASFAPLDELAIQRQTGDERELRAVFADPRFTKIVAWKLGQPVGLGVLTNHLDLIPELSPAFLRARYPHHAARDAIYIGIYVTVSSEHRGITLFSRITTEMWNVPAKADGILVFDICEFNREMFATDQLTLQIASAFPRSRVSTVDRQTWYVAELPEPVPGF